MASRELGADEARVDVGRAADAEGHDDLHRPRRVGLGLNRFVNEQKTQERNSDADHEFLLGRSLE